MLFRVFKAVPIYCPPSSPKTPKSWSCTSDTIISIWRRSFLRVFISCSGSLCIPTQQPLTKILVALKRGKIKQKKHKTLKHCAGNKRLMSVQVISFAHTLRLLLEIFLPGFPYSTLPRIPKLGMAETPQKCKPSGLSSSQVLLRDPRRNIRLFCISKPKDFPIFQTKSRELFQALKELYTKYAI